LWRMRAGASAVWGGGAWSAASAFGYDPAAGFGLSTDSGAYNVAAEQASSQWPTSASVMPVVGAADSAGPAAVSTPAAADVPGASAADVQQCAPAGGELVAPVLATVAGESGTPTRGGPAPASPTPASVVDAVRSVASPGGGVAPSVVGDAAVVTGAVSPGTAVAERLGSPSQVSSAFTATSAASPAADAASNLAESVAVGGSVVTSPAAEQPAAVRSPPAYASAAAGAGAAPPWAAPVAGSGTAAAVEGGIRALTQRQAAIRIQVGSVACRRATRGGARASAEPHAHNRPAPGLPAFLSSRNACA
jgi:hypothetical protein